ncbi:patatin-like phospholipase family protein [Methylomonas sp. HYX-M1]|uniref:patatin-like phospholipase family protein n=1 Tax=Methylomonas sp. HYX-M1 TaxID=3139307 RepID=UPI00345B5A22
MADDNQENSALTALKQQIKALKAQFRFGDARRALEQVPKELASETWVIQQLALCTYKDEELHTETRLQTALNYLEKAKLRDANTADPETLSLGGAVYKRLWECKGQLEHVFESLAFYRAAYERNLTADGCYGGANACYLLDVLAARAQALENRSGLPSADALRLRGEAADLRKRIKVTLDAALKADAKLKKDYWFQVTLGEIHFGLGEYPQAAACLDKAVKAEHDEWMLQTTFRQWVQLARQKGIPSPAEGQKTEEWHEAWQTLSHLLGADTAEALACHRGKVGLALSGGGFRASFFHLGLLARLAEVDALRSVEVLSSVSGGSILGAQYYLEVQRLLEDDSKTLCRQDYIDLVAKLQQDFLRGVESNIRMQALGDWKVNGQLVLGNSRLSKRLFKKTYTRSHKLGELYEKNLYSKVEDGRGVQPRHMPDLLVTPKHGRFQSADFKLKFHNWRRRAKVPMLLLNTTSLNSGHSWFFTASWMGEPPTALDIDCNERYRRLYYHQAPSEDLQHFRLGYAAAASSCVPGLFEPLVLDGLFQDRTVKLVDGGVHDNQGVQGLLEEGCTLIFCSDASGQMADSHQPAGDPAGVLLRTVSVLQDRIREAEYQDMASRLDSGALQGLFFVHTQKGLVPQPLDWLPDDITPSDDSGLTDYRIAKDLQRKIAAIRTDLDSFTEVEAYALMASGYLMTDRQLRDLDAQHRKDGKAGRWGGFEIEAERGNWEFLKLEKLLGQDKKQPSAQRDDLVKQLDVAGKLAFKAWHLIPQLKVAALALGLVAAYFLIKGLIALWGTSWTINATVVIVGIASLLGTIVAPALRWLNPKAEAESFLIKLGIAVAGYVVAKIHLLLFDRWFLQRGRLQRLLGLPAAAATSQEPAAEDRAG